MSTATLSKSDAEALETDLAPQMVAPRNGAKGTPPGQNGPRKRLLSARDYLKMGEMGWFGDQRVELINGDIIIMPPISEDHARSVDKSTTKLVVPLHQQYIIRCQQPFNAGENGRPQPDIAVVRPEAFQPNEPPAEALLLIEVSRSTLEYDRTTKASLYASLGVADYWIVNLINGTVEVRRQPIESAEAEFGWDYASRQIYQRGQTIALLEVPTVSLAVDEMLP